MNHTAADIYERLVEQADDGRITLVEGFSESDVQTWFDSIDVTTIENAADDQIDREVLSRLDVEVTGSATLREVIESHNDNPEEYSAGYVIRTDRTFVQYFKPQVSGKQPMDEQTAESELKSHITRLVDNNVASELLNRAKSEFTV